MPVSSLHSPSAAARRPRLPRHPTLLPASLRLHILTSHPSQVEFPDGRSTLCLLPAKFHKKLWVKNGNYLIVEDAPEAAGEGSRVTGQILAVLFADHVKQLKRMEGVW